VLAGKDVSIAFPPKPGLTGSAVHPQPEIWARLACFISGSLEIITLKQAEINNQRSAVMALVELLSAVFAMMLEAVHPTDKTGARHCQVWDDMSAGEPAGCLAHYRALAVWAKNHRLHRVMIIATFISWKFFEVFSHGGSRR